MTWSSRSLGSRCQHEFFRWLARLHLTAPARLLLYPLVFYYTLKPAVRHRSLPYLARRFPNAGPLARFGHAYRLYLNFAGVLLDRMVAGASGRATVIHHPKLDQLLTEAVAEGKGCIVLSAHFGGWQLGLAALEPLGRPLHIVQLRDPDDVDRHYFERRRGGPPIDIIDPRDSVIAFARIAAALRRNEIVCIMGDRLTDGDRHGEPVSFLGGTIIVPVSAYALASITGAPLAVNFTVREHGSVRGVWGEILHVPPGRRHTPGGLRPFAMHFTAALEHMVEKYPYHFFNFYNMWDEHDTSGTDY